MNDIIYWSGRQKDGRLLRGSYTIETDVLLERRLTADLYVTHGIFSKSTAELHARYEHIYCTDSFDGPREHVREIPVCARFFGPYTAEP